MIKVILFDLDGVLVDTKGLHYETFNSALESVKGPEGIIPLPEHLKSFDGLPSAVKVANLMAAGRLTDSESKVVLKKKRELTAIRFKELGLKEEDDIAGVLRYLKGLGYRLGLCSNCIRATVDTFIANSAFRDWDVIISNEDVKSPKPSPEMYMLAMIRLGVGPAETVVVEDSYVGITSARRSGAQVCIVQGPAEITESLFNPYMESMSAGREQDINILIPMAGAGSRFKESGYELPKPLIDVAGRPMIQVVVDSLDLDGRYIFLVQRAHIREYGMYETLRELVNSFRIKLVDGLTEGACCTTLLAEQFINDDKELMIVNSDQYIEWNKEKFFEHVDKNGLDACILTFRASETKWSYAAVDDNGVVTRVAEKEVISEYATVGIYWWRYGRDYVRFAKQMIRKDIRVKGEFYVCPVFNEAIESGLRIGIFDVDKMAGLGTPEDLESFLDNFNDTELAGV
jgi:HAD superfamily hydrolase (TIGR01509 family)